MNWQVGKEFGNGDSDVSNSSQCKAQARITHLILICGSPLEQSVLEEFLHPLLHWLMIFTAGLDNRRELRIAALKVSPTARTRGDCEYIGGKKLQCRILKFFVW